MNISLSKELEQLIQEKVKSGRYLSASEVVGEALRLLDERDRVQEARLAELKVKIREGIEASERGELVDGEEFFAELEEDIRHTAANANHRQGKGWPPGFFEDTFGAFKDDPLVIDSERIFENDLLIASIALANDLTLVTHNTGEFSRVEGLRIEDWAEALQEVAAWEVDWKSGIAAYQQAIDLNPESTYLYNGLGDMYYTNGNYSKAIAAYQEAIRLDPQYAYSHNGLGDIYAYQGKYDEAIAAYKRAIQLDPRCASAYNNLGWAYLMKDDLAQARNNFEEAIPLDPKRYYYPVFNLGLVYALEGKIDEAHSQWQESLTLCKGSSAWDRAFRSLYLVAVGESNHGIAEMRKIIGEDRSALGMMREMLGDAEVLARCPVKPEGIDTVIEMLKQAMAE